MPTNSIVELSNRLKQLNQAQPDRAATIDPKTKTTYADLVLVLNTAVLAGFTDITFKGSFED